MLDTHCPNRHKENRRIRFYHEPHYLPSAYRDVRCCGEYNHPYDVGLGRSEQKWVFSGAGIAVLTAIWWIVTKVRGSGREPVPVPPAPPNTVTQAPIINVSPSFNFPQDPTKLRTPAEANEDRRPDKVIPQAATLKARPNLKIEAIKIGKIALEGDIWTSSPGGRREEPLFRALLADVSNMPTELENTTTAKLKAAIRIEHGGQTPTYSPLPWLEEYTNTVYMEAAARKVVVLAVGKDSKIGEWYFILNHRNNHNSLSDPSRMDWTNLAPIPSGPCEILLIDVGSGALAATFKYLWTLDADLNYPVLKPAKNNG